MSETFQYPDWAFSLKAKMDDLEHNRTSDLVVLPASKKIMGCKWVFSVKHRAGGSLGWNKAQLVPVWNIFQNRTVRALQNK